MYGEKAEEAEELRLDLEDVKNMYKTQIDELLQNQKWSVVVALCYLWETHKQMNYIYETRSVAEIDGGGSQV